MFASWARIALFGALFTSSFFGAASALANGAFPQVSQLVADPADAAHLVLRSNFGLLTTHDGGRAWDLVCEAGLGYQNIEPPIAVLADGTTIAALPNGIARGASDECEFDLAADVATYMADVARVPGAPSEAVAVSVDFDGNASQVWHSADDGASFQAWGKPLSDLNAATLDVTSGGTLYVSGLSLSGAVTGVLARSTDSGQTWSRFDIPGVSKVSAPYIAALDANDGNTLYVRLSGTPGRLLRSVDGGKNFAPVLDFEGPFDGFALSPDGRFALASGRIDGVWRAPTSSLVFERISCAKLRCLSWSQSGLFACADEFDAGFLVGESSDDGLSFQPRLHLSCVRGPLACPAASAVARACDAAWPALSEQLGTDCAAASEFSPSTECGGGSFVAGAGGTASDAGAANASPGAGGRDGQASSLRPKGGGGCSVADQRSLPSAWLLGLSALCWLARRGRRDLTTRGC